MRILLLSGEYPPQPGGVGDYTRQLGLALTAAGEDVGVLTIQDGRVILYDLDEHGAAGTSLDKQSVIWAPRRPPDWSPRCWPVVRTAITHWRPAWMHIQYQTGAYAMQPGVNGLPWYLRRMLRRPRLAVTFHDVLEPYLFPKAGPLRRWVNLCLARGADTVVVTNAADLTQLQAAGLSPACIPIGSNIPVGPPPDFQPEAWRASLGVTPDTLLVAYFGLLGASKGVDLLVEALANTQPPWRLLLIGGAATAPADQAHAAAVRARIAALGLTERVIITGQVEPPVVSAHLRAADCVALPFRDGASLRRGSLLAALAHGCPIITTTPADPDAAALLIDGCSALLVPPGSSAALHAAIVRLAADAPLRQRLAAAGPPLAAPFAWERIAARHTALYRGEA